MLAGRDPPTAPWHSDPGWRQLVAVHRLDPFDPAESAELLAHAGVAPPVRPHLVTLGRGHPLTMALLADLAASGEVPDTLADAPNLISALLESFLGDVPSDAHLIGLATCATAWLTTEELLAGMVGADAAAVWQWLARRPFVTSTPRGLFAHDLVRDVLDAEFERRAPERYLSYRRAIRDHVVAGLRAATGLDRQLHGATDALHAARHPAHRRDLRPAGTRLRHGRPGRPDEHDQVCAIVERFEGPASAELARAWLDEQPEHLSVVRTGDGVAGFAYHVLSPSGSALEDRDPIVRAVLDHVAREGPTRPGERVGILRFSGAREHQPRPVRPAGRTPSRNVIEWLTRPLAWSFIIVVDSRATGHRFFDYMAFAPLVEVDIGGLRHVAYGIDWRRLPVDAYLDLLVERGRSGGTGPPPAALLRPPPLDRAAFRRGGPGRPADPAPPRPARRQPAAGLRVGRYRRRAERRPTPDHDRTAPSPTSASSRKATSSGPS